MRITAAAVLGLLLLAACGKKDDQAAADAAAAPSPLNLSYQEIPASKKYPLKTCVVTGKDLHEGGRKPYAISYKGYEVQFCSKDCINEFAKDPDTYVRKVNPLAILDK